MSREAARVRISCLTIQGRREEFQSTVRCTVHVLEKKPNFTRSTTKMIDSTNVKRVIIRVILVSRMFAKWWRKPGGCWSCWCSL